MASSFTEFFLISFLPCLASQLFSSHYLYGMSQPAEGEQVESVLKCGLVKGHAYSITAVRKIRVGDNLQSVCRTSRICMVRMRNPWGMADWTGAWSQG